MDTKPTTKLKKGVSLFYAVIQCYRYSFGASFLLLLISILNGILPSMMIYVVSSFLDSASSIVTSNPKIYSLTFSSLVIIGYYAFNSISNIVERYANSCIENSLSTEYKPIMVEKIASYKYEWIEDRKINDLTQRVFENMEEYFTDITYEFNVSIRIAIQTIGILSILWSQQWWLVPFFLILIIPLVVLSFRGGKYIYEIDQESTMLTRMIKYLSDILTNRDSGPERVLFRFTKGVDSIFCKTHLKRTNITTEAIARAEIKTKCCVTILNMFLVLCLFMLMQNVQKGLLSGGLYISIVGTMITLVRSNAGVLARISIKISSYISFMDDFMCFLLIDGDKEYLSFKEQDVDFNIIQIRDLSFHYPNTEEYVLRHVNLTLEKGKIYALIGINGAGKTTLIKILTGLYDNYEGEVLINGINIKLINNNYLRNLFSVVYQDYARYALTLKDNITLGKGEKELNDIIRQCGLSDLIKRIPGGINTHMGKFETDGVDVSGGEWQKIAIARALYKDSPFLLLDEPTSSLSPMMESNVYRQVAEIVKNRAVLFISHRLGFTQIADVIYVISKGEVIEEGTHQELMERHGLYAEMFNSQKEWYENE